MKRPGLLLVLAVPAVLAVLAVAVVVTAPAWERRAADDPLAAFAGGFDPTRYDAGTLVALEPAALGRPLRFNVPPFYAERPEGSTEALEKYLEEQTGLDVEIRTPPAYSYREIADVLASGEVDIAQLSPWQYALVLEAGVKLEPVAASVAHGASSYGSYLVVKRGSPIRRIDDIRGKKLAFVDPLSASGYVFPALWLGERGFDLDKDVHVSFAGSHPAALRAVLEGAVDVAAVSSDLLIGNAGLAGPLVVVAKVGRMPYDVIVARPGLDGAVLSHVRRALLRLSIHDERGRSALRTFSSVDAFMPIPPGHYDEVIGLARNSAARGLRPVAAPASSGTTRAGSPSNETFAPDAGLASP